MEMTFGGSRLVLVPPGYGPSQNSSTPPIPSSVGASSRRRRLLNASAPPDQSSSSTLLAQSLSTSSSTLLAQTSSSALSSTLLAQTSSSSSSTLLVQTSSSSSPSASASAEGRSDVPGLEGFEDKLPLSLEPQGLCCRSSGLHRYLHSMLHSRLPCARPPGRVLNTLRLASSCLTSRPPAPRVLYSAWPASRQPAPLSQPSQTS
ncbi:hypothetical protein CRENBAI_006835 [Crenichthys baileyi]|uniref:Uncharacterized protein n=1 Tax=Crenichthys baileyi TaxID=28760 RepID=A0AAV9QMD5_9TELE